MMALAALALAGCSALVEAAEFDPEAEASAAAARGLPAALLWSAPYSRLIVEVDYVEDRAPLKSTLEAVLMTLEDHTRKASVELLEPTLIVGHAGDQNRRWDQSSLAAFHDATFDHAPPPGAFGWNDTVAIHLMFLDGSYLTQNGKARGLYTGTSLTVFPDELSGWLALDERRDAGLPATPEYAAAERRVAVHETGHALGLVGCGIAALVPRAYPDSPCHSTHRESVMHPYRGDFTSNAREWLAGGEWQVWTFDEADKADLAAHRALEPGRASR